MNVRRIVMKKLRTAILVAAFSTISLWAYADPATMPAPPSAEPHPIAKPVGSLVRVLVDVIPANAKYIDYAQLRIQELPDVNHLSNFSGAISNEIAKMAENVPSLGGNLLVLLSQAHGMQVPISQSKRPLILAPTKGAIVVLLFNWEGDGTVTKKETEIQFLINAETKTKPSMTYRIELKSRPEGEPLAFWVYMNISRFVKDALACNAKRISLNSTNDAEYEEVFLPSCDQTLRVSKKHPLLETSIYP